MALRFSQAFGVRPNTELVITAGGRSMVVPILANAAEIAVTIEEREVHATERPEIGSPSLSVNPATAGMRVR
jgi:hypothetical protein